MVHPLMVSSTMVLLTVNMYDVLNLVEMWFNLKWGCIETYITYTMYIGTVPWLSMIVVWMITIDEMERKKIRNMLDFSRNVTSFCVYSMCTFLFFSIFWGMLEVYFWLLVATATFLIWSIVVGVKCHQALDISTQLLWKLYLINVMVGIIWIVIFCGFEYGSIVVFTLLFL